MANYMKSAEPPHTFSLGSLDKILLELIVFEDKSMLSCQVMGFNGFKRRHRRNVRCYNNLHLKLENEAYDNSKMIITSDYPTDNYVSNDVINHLEVWDTVLSERIKEISELNAIYFNDVGIECKIGKELLHHLLKNREKTSRWLKRFKETNEPHDWHMVDDRLHDKEKAKEEKEMRGYY